ncbi:DUF3040 domain-containing protein [Phycicoccus sp. CSK15P-2]|uniref:DUF3040 domain-containing protein n=1 Tax=Phycicoccus sp. CSK15P-2 TaxID=2807627 RepID=UPI00194FC6AC|nr:DUF3040 domain-containing protein [Phycicoccus sp. CSK15P-2]MBM6404011.1 DUF3040 domain-containing protein [Phycicoccus sp. CSK15P-2]
MPLSDHEQQMLEQMEQALTAEDPKFASQMKSSGLGSIQRRRWVVGAVGVLIGLGLVLVGVNTTMWVGAVGFAVMVMAAVFAATPSRASRLGVVSEDGTVQSKGARSRKKGGSLIDRLDERWERRENNW